ncbi:MAG: hypothetical protein ACE5FH_03945 [Candidatus Zixiibacteriota bacterium]
MKRVVIMATLLVAFLIGICCTDATARSTPFGKQSVDRWTGDDHPWGGDEEGDDQSLSQGEVPETGRDTQLSGYFTIEVEVLKLLFNKSFGLLGQGFTFHTLSGDRHPTIVTPTTEEPTTGQEPVQPHTAHRGN